MKKLIINADDFGLHTEINQAIIKGHRAGCITSTSLMAMGKAFAEAVELSEKNKALGVGVHLTLVAEAPVLDIAKVKTLVDKDGQFVAEHTAFIRRYIKGEINLAEIYQEFSAQIERVRAAGVPITHLDSHQHLHVLPKITEICIDLAKKYQIKAMRIPAEQYCFTGGYPVKFKRLIGRCGLTWLAERARRRVKLANIVVPDHFFGMLAGGHLAENYLTAIILALPSGSSEIMLHPGLNAQILGELFDWNYQWEQELRSATSPAIAQLIRSAEIQLSSFGELSNE